MDLSPIIGVAAGMAALVISVIWARVPIQAYADMPSFFTTVIGSICAMAVGHGIGRFLKAPKWVGVILRKKTYQEERIIAQLVAFSEKARREGLLSLEEEMEQIEDEFTRKGLQLVVDGTDPEIIRTILYNDVTQLNSRHQVAMNFFGDWAGLAPAFGMIGTLLGLVGMLLLINDKESVGRGMALALVTSLYGAIMCYLVFTPFKRVLRDKNDDELAMRELIIEGILSIQSGDNPRIVEEKLVTFLAPAQREAVRAEAAKE
jgi:chemotaxis protein MotA